MRWAILAALMLACSVGNEKSSDPTERGLSYVAGAILSAAVIKAIFNK